MGTNHDENNNNNNHNNEIELPEQFESINIPENENEEDVPNVGTVIRVKNPFYLIKSSAYLQKDKINNIYFIKFKYDSLINFDCYINFNVTKNNNKKKTKNKKYELCYEPIAPSKNGQILIKNLKKGKNVEFRVFFRKSFF